MNILHISDLHFGTRHWAGNDEMLLDKLNSYSPDIVINTGDSTTDSLECEFQATSNFLKALKCEHVISIAGNHDKRNMRCQDFFQQYISKVDCIHPQNPENCKKGRIFIDKNTVGIKDRFTDINFLKKIEINGESTLFVCLDTNEVYEDNGYVDPEMLATVTGEIERSSYDQIMLLCHHPILETDRDPLFESTLVIDFIKKHNIHHVFCGHTHKLSISKYTDMVEQYSFTQFTSSTLTSHSHPLNTNIFLFYENVGTKDMTTKVIKIFVEGNQLTFEEDVIVNEEPTTLLG